MGREIPAYRLSIAIWIASSRLLLLQHARAKRWVFRKLGYGKAVARDGGALDVVCPHL